LLGWIILPTIENLGIHATIYRMTERFSANNGIAYIVQLVMIGRALFRITLRKPLAIGTTCHLQFVTRIENYM
jgi:hypothetical protein